MVEEQLVPFGDVLGHALGNIPVYSCHVSNVGVALSQLEAHSEVSCSIWCGMKLYYGCKYQCVEFARRWLIHALGVTFGDVVMAFEIFDMQSAFSVREEAPIPWLSVNNGSAARPEIGSALIWTAGGQFEGTGHVAIITEVGDDHVNIAEQNVFHVAWPDGQNYARSLSLIHDTATGGYTIMDPRLVEGTRISGWKTLADFERSPIPIG